MGANYQEMTIDGSKTRKQVETMFAEAQDQDRYENGHSYSGGFGMASGLKLLDQTFESEQAAHEYLDGRVEGGNYVTNGACQKWGPAIGVRYAVDGGGVLWLIGALCAS